MGSEHSERTENLDPQWMPKDRDWDEYPAGTKAHSHSGGAWIKCPNGGWQWNGHISASGGTFPRPGPDAMGVCVELPLDSAEETERPRA